MGLSCVLQTAISVAESLGAGHPRSRRGWGIAGLHGEPDGGAAPSEAQRAQGPVLKCSSAGHLVPHVHADWGGLARLLQTLPGLWEVAEQLPERLSSTESGAHTRPILQLHGHTYHAIRPLTAPGRGHHLQLGIVWQVGESPLDRQVKHAPLELEVIFAGVEVLLLTRVLQNLGRWGPGRQSSGQCRSLRSTPEQETARPPA